jgi:endonuclease/exonuclease/phosphatase family metal-dependent hydrolase
MAAEVELPGCASLVAVSVHARILEGYVRPNLDRAFDALGPLLADRSFVLGGDLNLSRNYDTVYGTTHHTEFLDGLAARGYFDCMRKFHAEEQQTFWKKGMKNAYQDDHLFVSPDLAMRVVSCDVVDRAGLSDHSPLSALARKFADVFGQAALAAGWSRRCRTRSRSARVNFHSNGAAICW